ncbi:hypothetical protein PI126_g21687 [Phytophthora idaei]|nr:hypothetical protein PI126_g21687 [Phytophthora idaei]
MSSTATCYVTSGTFTFQKQCRSHPWWRLEAQRFGVLLALALQASSLRFRCVAFVWFMILLLVLEPANLRYSTTEFACITDVIYPRAFISSLLRSDSSSFGRTQKHAMIVDFQTTA